MNVEVTESAAEVLQRSLKLGGVDPGVGGIRLRGAHSLGGGFDVQVELAAGPEEGDQVVETGGLRLFIEPAVGEAIPDAIVDLELQHDIVTVKPSTP
jgi:Fe-S cluster assembly iron-binding protein IscA